MGMSEEPKDLIAIDHGKHKIDLSHLKATHIVDFLPTELHHKEDGDLNNEPSSCFVLERPSNDTAIIGQISLKMLNEGLNEIGYRIERIDNE